MAGGGKAVLATGLVAAAVVVGKDVVLTGVESPAIWKRAATAGATAGIHATNSTLDITGSRLTRSYLPEGLGQSGEDLLKARTHPELDSILPRVAGQYFVHQNYKVSEYTHFFDAAEPRIINEISGLAPPITTEKLDQIIRSQVVKVVNETREESDQKFTFEALTGKLTIDSSMVIYGAKTTGGDINVYKISAAIATSAMTATCWREALTKNALRRQWGKHVRWL